MEQGVYAQGAEPKRMVVVENDARALRFPLPTLLEVHAQPAAWRGVVPKGRMEELHPAGECKA